MIRKLGWWEVEEERQITIARKLKGKKNVWKKIYLYMYTCIVDVVVMNIGSMSFSPSKSASESEIMKCGSQRSISSTNFLTLAAIYNTIQAARRSILYILIGLRARYTIYR
jgi:hypothetical protein